MSANCRHALAAVAALAALVQQSLDLSPTLHTIASMALVLLAAYGIYPPQKDEPHV